MITLRRRLTAIHSHDRHCADCRPACRFILACRQIDSADCTYFFSQCNALVQRLTTESSFPATGWHRWKRITSFSFPSGTMAAQSFSGSYSPPAAVRSCLLWHRTPATMWTKTDCSPCRDRPAILTGVFCAAVPRNGPCEVILLQSPRRKMPASLKPPETICFLLSLCLLGLWGCSRLLLPSPFALCARPCSGRPNSSPPPDTNCEAPSLQWKPIFRL